MKISTKGRYALRLMLELALHDANQWISVKEIAKNQEISGKYLEQIITQLHRAMLVQSVRGAQGGYRLAKRPKRSRWVWCFVPWKESLPPCPAWRVKIAVLVGKIVLR